LYFLAVTHEHFFLLSSTFFAEKCDFSWPFILDKVFSSVNLNPPEKHVADQENPLFYLDTEKRKNVAKQLKTPYPG